jgi:uncharacterized protein (TIGR03435 family)
MRHLSHKVVLVVTAIAIAVTPVASQAPSAQKPSFEVASIKPNKSDENRVAILGQPGGRFVATNISLTRLMDAAYSVREFQILGGPNWIRTDRWNIEAKAPEGSIPPPSAQPDPATINPMTLMLQSLIEDRFQLKMHRDTRELPVYELVIASGGPKIKISEDQGPVRPPEPGVSPQRGGPMPRGSARLGRGDFEANGVPFGTLITALSQALDRVVIDKTSFKGRYDIKLQWTPEIEQGPGLPGGPESSAPRVDAQGPSIFTALQEQLGLRLESSKGPVEVIVIDSVQKPSEN